MVARENSFFTSSSNAVSGAHDLGVRLLNKVNLLVVVKGNLEVQLGSAGGLLVLLGGGNFLAGGGRGRDSVIRWLSLQVQGFKSVVEDLDPELARAAWNWQSIIATEGGGFS